MNILVTGAAGFIGSHLSERLAALGHHVRGVDCLTDYYARALKELNMRHITDKGIVFHPLDLALDDLSPAVEGMLLKPVRDEAAEARLSAAAAGRGAAR